MYKSIPGKEGIEAVETTLKIKNMGTRIIKQKINEVHPSINFDFNFCNSGIIFLDTFVYKTQSLFTNILIKETIEYILDQVCNKERLKTICSKLIFKCLLKKLATKVTFTINKNVDRNRWLYNGWTIIYHSQ